MEHTSEVSSSKMFRIGTLFYLIINSILELKKAVLLVVVVNTIYTFILF